MSLYINGQDAGGSYSGTGGSLIHTSAHAKIGGLSDTISNFNGIIDDVLIYNRALTETEIQTLYHEDGWGQ